MNPSDAHAMTLPLALVCVVAPLGAVDVLYFHIWKFQLYRVPSARAETVTHLLRGTMFSFVAYLLATYRFGGLWFWAVGAMFLLEFLNNLADVALEPRSRATLGGVPGLEYLIHTVGSTFAGAIAVSFFVVGWPGRVAPTALLSAAGALPGWLAFQGRTVAISAGLLTLFELALLLRSVAAERVSGDREATTTT